MPRIRLRIEERPNVQEACHYREAGRVRRHVPLLRLTTVARVQPPPGRAARPRVAAALIDTGAWLSAVRYDEWQEYDRDGLIEHLPFADGRAEMTAGFAGTASGYRLGRLRVELLDLLPGPRFRYESLPAVPVVAQLLLNPRITERQMPHPILLGLHLGVLDGRRLIREPVRARPAAVPTTDIGRVYGQEWYLETV